MDFYEEKEFDGEVWFRVTPGGAYQKKQVLFNNGDAPVDKLLKYLSEYLGIPRRLILLATLDIDSASISRIRTGKSPIHANLWLRMHDVSGLSCNELRVIAGLPIVPTQPRAAVTSNIETPQVGTAQFITATSIER